ncbi:MAG TPA: oligosaccharide flippase family protein [Candidatus Didemnitutus sp.]|nr:oligosaccharide flippase family protein [Candidatus Didemnitutus sp.]
MTPSPSLFEKARARLQRVPRQFSMFFATSLVARGVGIGCQLLQVPLVVRALGPEAFGLWMTMTSFTNLVLFADLGLGIGAQNRLAEHLARGERDEARELLMDVFLLLAGVGTVIAALLTFLMLQVDFVGLFHLHEPATMAQAPTAGLVMAWVFCANFPFGLAQRLAFARQEGWLYNVAQALASVTGLVLVAIGVARGWTFAGLVGAAQGALLVGNMSLFVLQLRQMSWLARWRLRVRLSAVRDLLQVGAFFSVQQILTTVLFSLPQVIISTRLGAAVVTPYNLVQRLLNLFAIIQNAFMLPLWPAYSHAKAQQKFDWIRSALRRSVLATAGCCVVPMVICACFAPTIIRLWVGNDSVRPTGLLIALLCVWNTLAYFQQPYSYLLAGVSEIRRTTLYAVLSACASTALMYALARPFGVPGVVIGLILGYLPFNFIGNVVETRRYLDRTARPLAMPAPSPVAG